MNRARNVSLAKLHRGGGPHLRIVVVQAPERELIGCRPSKLGQSLSRRSPPGSARGWALATAWMPIDNGSVREDSSLDTCSGTSSMKSSVIRKRSA